MNDFSKQSERPDPKAAARDPGPGARNRPGFDLGGAVDKNPSTAGSNVMPESGPKGSPAQGTTAGGQASGLTDPSGSSSGEHKGSGSAG